MSVQLFEQQMVMVFEPYNSIYSLSVWLDVDVPFPASFIREVGHTASTTRHMLHGPEKGALIHVDVYRK